MYGRSHLLRIIGCGLTGCGLLLTGGAALPLSSGLGPVALTRAAPTPVPPAVRVQVIPGQALAGEAIKLTLHLTVIELARPVSVVVTDLLPVGVRYVPGSSRLATATRSATLADPIASVTSHGTLLMWSKVTVATGGAKSLVLAVAPAAATGRAGDPDLGAAGRAWTDQATVRAPRAGRPALVATNQAAIEVVPVAAVQTGHLVAPAQPTGRAYLRESLTVSSTRAGRADDVIVRVYLPGVVTWAGCVPGRCTRPTVSDLRLPVTATQPDRPGLAPLPAGTTPTTTAPPAVTAGTKPAPTARFTVLTWRLGTLPAGTSRTLNYRLAASPVSQPRTLDLVTATARLTTTTGSATISGAANHAVTEAPSSAAVVTHESATIRASTLQVWPGSAAIATDAANGAATTTTTNTIDPFGSTSTTTTPTASSTSTTTNTSGTTSTTTKTSSTTAPKAGLATTGTDALQTGEVGLGLTGVGGLVLLSSFIRRRRHPAPDDPSAPTDDR